MPTASCAAIFIHLLNDTARSNEPTERKSAFDANGGSPLGGECPAGGSAGIRETLGDARTLDVERQRNLHIASGRRHPHRISHVLHTAGRLPAALLVVR